MTDEKIYEEYVIAKALPDVRKRAAKMEECLQQVKDVALKTEMQRDLGIIYMTEPSVKNEQKAEAYFREAAKADDDIALQMVGIILFNRGDIKAFDFLQMAVELGNPYSAYIFWDNLNKFRADGSDQAKGLVNILERHVKDAVQNSKDALEYETNGAPQAALALLGLYGLGEKYGITQAMGREYLQQGAKMGNANAQYLLDNPQFQTPQGVANANGQALMDEAKEADKLASREVKSVRRARAGLRVATIVKIAILVAVAVVIFINRGAIVEAVSDFVGGIADILLYVVLGVIGVLAIIAYLTDGSIGGTNELADSVRETRKEYERKTSLANLPETIYDDSGVAYYRHYSSTDWVEYKSYDGDEVTIRTWNGGNTAYSTSGRNFHWY